MCDLLWSDPEGASRLIAPAVSISHPFSFFFHVEVDGWGVSPRGAGYLFGSKVAEEVRLDWFPCCSQGS